MRDNLGEFNTDLSISIPMNKFVYNANFYS